MNNIKNSKLREHKKYSINIIKIKCAYCGKEKEILNYFKKKYNHFCNRECYLNYHTISREVRVCKNEKCNKEFITKKNYNVLYCCKNCYKENYITNKYGKFNKKGYFFSEKMKKEIRYDSFYELSRLKQLEIDDNIIFFDRCPYKIKYLYEDKYKIYHPDFFIIEKYINDKGENDLKFFIEEIKGMYKKLDTIKISLVKKWCEDKLYIFRILEYKDIYNDDFLIPLYDSYINKYGKFIRLSFEYLWMKNTLLISQRSTCLRMKVGCTITDINFWNSYSFGYNGNLPGKENGCNTLEPGSCGCIHAEINAINKIKNNENFKNINDCILFTSLSPCFSCAQEIINFKKIKKVIYYECYRNTSGIKLLKQNNIEVISWQEMVKLKNNNFLI